MRRIVAAVTLVLALAVVAVLTLRAFGVPIALGPDSSASPSTPASATPDASDGASPSLEDELAAIEAEVADIRDLPAADIGPAELLTRDELERRLAERFDEDYPPDEQAADDALFHALGLLAPDQDYAELRLQLLSSQVLGYYDDVANQMVVVTDGGLTAEARVTYAHEYTHALQDAAFGIDSLDLDADGDDDGVYARLGLLEGDATTVMVLWTIENLTPEEMLGISQTPLPDTSGVPAWMVSELEFPYLAGTEFSAQLYATGGFSAVDEAWADPPLTTEQVLHYAAYVEDESVIAPDPIATDPPSGVDLVEASTFGEEMVSIWLAALGVDGQDADAAAAGWGGDQVTTFAAADGELAVALQVVWDSAADAEQFAAAYEDALGRLQIFGQLVRISETEVVVYQGTSREFVESITGPLD
jgi:hypothetical protein